MAASDDVDFHSTESAEINQVCVVMRQMYEIWNELGIDQIQKLERAKIVWDHVKSLLADILAEEQLFLDQTNERIAVCLDKIDGLSNCLQVTQVLDVNEHISLIDKEEELRLQLDKLARLKHERMETYQYLRSKERRLCDILGLEPHKLSSNTEVPSERDLKEIERCIELLEEEKDKRYQTFYTARKELTTIMEVTELTPETDLENEILSGQDVKLTNEFLQKTLVAVEKAQQKRTELESRTKFLLSNLTDLCHRLKVDDEIIKDFLKDHSDCRLSTLLSIEKEIEKYEKIKHENLKMFVESLRRELDELWEKCCVSDSDKESFYFYNDAEMTDSLLSLHEAEVEKWKTYYQELEHVFSNIMKRQILWVKLIVLENKSTDPNRFKNRKGNLLQEERDRKKTQKELHALETKIQQDIEAYSLKTGKLFKYYGEDYDTFVKNQLIEKNNRRENEKLERNQQHKLPSDKTPFKKLLVTSPTTTPLKLSSPVRVTFPGRRHAVRVSPPATKSVAKRLSVRQKRADTSLLERNCQEIEAEKSLLDLTNADFPSKKN